MVNLLTAAASHDYRPDSIGVVDHLTFATSETFPEVEVNASQLSSLLQVTGDSSPDGINVYLTIESDFSAAGWGFATWTGYVSIYGHSGGNSITGSSTYNFIIGNGTQTLIGGPTGNGFMYAVASDIAPGQTVTGGAGEDDIRVAGAADFDFSAAHLSNIDDLIFEFIASTDPMRAILAGDQIGSGAITVVENENPLGHPVALIVRGSTANLTGVTFNGWNPDENTITIKGTSGNDRLTGSIEPDKIKGGGGKDKLKGGSGDDVLNGGTAKDILSGGAGNDKLKGAAGNDTFLFDTALNGATNVDLIVRFIHGHDTIGLEHSIFSVIPLGHLSAGAFHIGRHANDASDHIIYNQAQGKLFYDDDGNGPDGKTLFAVIDNHTTLSASDFVIV